jgi:hypothetical protein
MLLNEQALAVGHPATYYFNQQHQNTITMRNLRYPILLLLALFLAACTQEPLADSLTETDTLAQEVDAEEMVAQAEAEVKAILAEIEADEAAVAKGPAVYVPSGSTDALADALAAAGPNGRVVLKSGPHYETQTVVIAQRVRLEGEPGAVLYSSAAAADLTTTPISILPAIHVLGADRTRITGLDIRPAAGEGNSAILVEDASAVRIHSLTIQDFSFGVVLFGADHAHVVGNTVSGLGPVEDPNGAGVFVIKGQYVRLFNNEISHFSSNIFTSDYRGLAFGNQITDGEVGMLVCTAPPNYLTPDGTVMQAPVSSNQWLIMGNEARDNLLAGYSIIDGSFNNRVFYNKASGNGLLDIVLFPAFQGETMFFPVTSDNLVISVFFPDITIMDCGDNNTVIGGTAVDCFL